MSKYSEKLKKSCGEYLLSVAKQNRKSITGTFSLSGYRHLWFFRKIYIVLFVKVDHPVTFRACPNNIYDNEAIRVFYNKKFIGWVSREYNNKKRLFCYIVLEKKLEAYVRYIHDDYDGTYKQIEISFNVENPDRL